MGKKILAIVLTLLVIGGAAGGFFFRRWYREKALTDKDKWTTVTHAEYTVTLPKTMQEIQDFSFADNSMTPLTAYSTGKAGFSVGKLDYTGGYERLKDLDVEGILEKMKFGGSTLLPEKTASGGYYVTYSQNVTENGTSKLYYFIEGIYKGKNAMYSATAVCGAEDLSELKPYMIEWIDSFRTTN